MIRKRPVYALASLLIPLVGLIIAFTLVGINLPQEPIDHDYHAGAAIGAAASIIRSLLIFLGSAFIGFVCGFLGLIRGESRPLSIIGMSVPFVVATGFIFLSVISPT